MNQNMIYDVSYMDALKRGFKQYVTFSGRASRSEFWRFMVCREIILDGLACFGLIVDMVLGNTSAASDYAMVLLFIFLIVRHNRLNTPRIMLIYHLDEHLIRIGFICESQLKGNMIYIVIISQHSL